MLDIADNNLLCSFHWIKTDLKNIFRDICTGEGTLLTHLRMIASLHSESYKAEEKEEKKVVPIFWGFQYTQLWVVLRLLLSKASCFNSLELR